MRVKAKSPIFGKPELHIWGTKADLQGLIAMCEDAIEHGEAKFEEGEGKVIITKESGWA